MRFLEVLGGAVTGALDFVIDKNKVQAQVNRLRLVMRNESQLMDKSYIALGKYYYNELREQQEHAANEKICQTIDKSKVRMDRARAHYHTLMENQIEDYSDAVMDIDEGDITLCCSYDDVKETTEPASESEEADSPEA